MGCMCNQCKINTQQMPYMYLLIVEFHIKRSVIPIFLANPPKWDSIHCNTNIFLQVQQYYYYDCRQNNTQYSRAQIGQNCPSFLQYTTGLNRAIGGVLLGICNTGQVEGDTNRGKRGGYPTKKRPLANHMTEPFFLMLYVL